MHALRNKKLGAFAVLLSDSLKDATGELSPSAAALLLTLFYSRDTTITELAKVGRVSQPTLDKILRAATLSRAFARTTCRLCDHTHCDGPLCPIGTRAAEIERAARPKLRRRETC